MRRLLECGANRILDTASRIGFLKSKQLLPFIAESIELGFGEKGEDLIQTIIDSMCIYIYTQSERLRERFDF